MDQIRHWSRVLENDLFPPTRDDAPCAAEFFGYCPTQMCLTFFFIELENMTFKRYKLIKMIRYIFSLNIF